jgi:lipoprotein-anchoring transpeptidase ErfK/SrfK
MPKQTGKKGAAKKRAKQKRAKKPADAQAVQLDAANAAVPEAPKVSDAPQIETPAVPTPEEPEFPTKHPKWYRALIYGSLSFATLIAIWLCGGIFWSKITVGSTTVSGTTGSTQLESLISAQAAAYHVTLRYPDGKTYTYPLRTLGLTPDTTASVKAVRNQQRSPLHLFAWCKPVNATVTMRVDNTALGSFIASKATIVSKEPQNATLAIKDGKTEITSGKDGTVFGFSNAAHTILEAAQGLQTAPLQLGTVTRPPVINAQTLAPVKEKVDGILGQHIALHIGGDEVTPNAKDIANWLTLTPTSTSVEVSLNQDKLKEYVNGQATGHTKLPHSQVVSDSTGAVISRGANGVNVGKTDDASKTIAEHVMDAEGSSSTLPTTSTAYKTVRAPTAGKWIEVDLTTKRMYAYNEGDIVHTFLVSAGAAGTPTVTGRFAIYSKYTSQDMFGANADGSRYFQPRVPYINYFYRDYAIHGNYWRPASYFGNINSSHGCVGISVSEGAWMYSWAPIGTPVIVHT